MELNVYIVEDIPVFKQPRYNWNSGVSHLSSNFQSSFLHYSLTHVDKHRVSVVLYVYWYHTRTDKGWREWIFTALLAESAATTTNTDRKNT